MAHWSDPRVPRSGQDPAASLGRLWRSNRRRRRRSWPCVVAHEPGPWFDEVLDSLAAPGLPEPVGPRHRRRPATGDLAPSGRAAPPGRLRAPARRPTLGSAPPPTRSLKLVEGAGFFCFLHDDVALDADADPRAGRGGVPLERRHRRAEAGRLGRPAAGCWPWDERRQGRRARRRSSSRASSTRSSTTPCATSSACRPAACSCASTCSTPSAASTPTSDLRRRPRPVLARPRRRCARAMVNPDTRACAHAETEERACATTTERACSPATGCGRCSPATGRST